MYPSSTISPADPVGWHGTTILCVRRDGSVAMAGDGQVSLGQTVVKGNARKVRRIGNGSVVAGSAPRGNVYSFPAGGGAPVFLQGNRDAEGRPGTCLDAVLAETVRFELTEELPPRQFSRLLP